MYLLNRLIKDASVASRVKNVISTGSRMLEWDIPREMMQNRRVPMITKYILSPVGRHSKALVRQAGWRN